MAKCFGPFIEGRGIIPYYHTELNGGLVYSQQLTGISILQQIVSTAQLERVENSNGRKAAKLVSIRLPQISTSTKNKHY